MTPSIAIVTHQGMPEGVADDKLLEAELRNQGVQPQFTVWNDKSVDWCEFDLAVIRSTWDYHLQPAAWLAWIEEVSQITRLMNSAEIIRWNCDKSYLLELAGKGVAVVPTAAPTSAEQMQQICNKNGWQDVVIKPTIGASSFGAQRFQGIEMATAGVQHFQELSKKRKVIVQPYQKVIESEKERSLVYIDQQFSHAFSKPAFHADLDNQLLKHHEASNEEKYLAQQILNLMPASPVFARIDILPSDSGPLLMEAELIEPELALHFNRNGAARLAKALIRTASGIDN